jgi:hypothetical protein
MIEVVSVAAAEILLAHPSQGHEQLSFFFRHSANMNDAGNARNIRSWVVCWLSAD